MTDSNRVMLVQLLTLAVARNKWVVGMDTEGTCYRVRLDTSRIGQLEVDQRPYTETAWKNFARGSVSDTIQTMLQISVPVTGWQPVVKG